MDKKKLLGKRIRELRSAKKWTLANLAEKIGVEPSSLGNIENGYNYPKLSTLESLSDAFGCKMVDLFDFEHHNSQNDLLSEINNSLKNHPERIQDVYKIVQSLIK